MRKNLAIREIDSIGRIVIPVQLRRALKLDKKSLVEVYIEDDHILIKKHVPTCVFCGSEDNICKFSEKPVCRVCISKIKKL